METNYNEILERIKTIIELSIKMSKSLGGHEVDDQVFDTIGHFKIAKIYANEFKKLLENENVFYAFINNENVFQKNNELLNECRVLHTNTPNEEYSNLINILINSFSADYEELVEYFGYYVKRDELNNFRLLCRSLQIGPGELVSNVYDSNVSEAINDNYLNNKNQYLRISSYVFGEFIEEDKNNLGRL